ncbi:MAG: DUF1294 domain-containing protein [Thaumarchaeota archaeon]|nr:DUF1294 domain-containing protein [Nitrososphaerota archaeon]
MLSGSCLTNPFIEVLAAWLLVTGILGAVAMGLDKGKAHRHERRISERTLFLISITGGFWGVLLGGGLAHHKTSKISFQIVVLATSFVWLLGIAQILTRAGCFS